MKNCTMYILFVSCCSKYVIPLGMLGHLALGLLHRCVNVEAHIPKDIF